MRSSDVTRLLGLLPLFAVITVRAGVVDVAPDKLVDYLGTQKSVVVQFTSPDKGCKPCLKSYKDFEQFAEKNAGRSAFVRVEWNPYHKIPMDIKKRFRILAMPAQMCFREEKKLDTLMGPLGKVSQRRLEQFEGACF